MEPITRSTKGFCQGDRGALTTSSSQPRRRRKSPSPSKAEPRSRWTKRGGSSRAARSWLRGHSAVGGSGASRGGVGRPPWPRSPEPEGTREGGGRVLEEVVAAGAVLWV